MITPHTLVPSLLLTTLLHADVAPTFLGPTEAAKEAGFVTPVEKSLSAAARKELFSKGERKVYRGEELHTIGMPCGGIGAGQLYLRGDGTLARWLIFGQHMSTHWSQLMNGKPAKFGYHTYRPESELSQGFSITFDQGENGDSKTYSLSQQDFDDIRFVGEYPFAEIHYRHKTEPMPVEVDMEVFTPWIPLDPKASAYPATVLRFHLTNRTDSPATISLSGWLENGVGLETREKQPDLSLETKFVKQDGLTFLNHSSSGMGKEKDAGTMGLALLGDPADLMLPTIDSSQLPTLVEGDSHIGALGRKLTLAAGASVDVTYLVTWHFPHYVNPDDRGKTGAVGRMYSNWFKDATAVATDLAAKLPELERRTRLFRDTYYDSTLPYWFIQRVAMPSSTLSSLTSQWWEDGRFYHYEGVGFCAGTCTHVYAYSQATAHLFPSLERNMRSLQDLAAPAQDPQTGRINFRGRDYKLGTSIHASGWAADGQAGVVLRAYREHLQSPDDTFLEKNWPAIKLAIDYLVARDGEDDEDGEADGILRVPQHNTWDVDFPGPNTYIGALYLAALRAGGEMADLRNDADSAQHYRQLADKGSSYTEEKLWNGDYFVHEYPADSPVKPSKSWGNILVSYSDGCFSNQLFGQNWSEQLGLGDLYAQDKVRKTLRSIYRYNFFPDISVLYATGKPYNYVLIDGNEGGLLQGTWPLTPRPINAVKLTEHAWTGFEYQVASHLLRQGFIEEGFRIVRAVHDRYDGTDHNPWNEIEGGDHYGRAMASWSCLTAISGYRYNGPKKLLAFAPRFTEDNFKAFFSASEGWGSYARKREGKLQTDELFLADGTLALRTLELGAWQRNAAGITEISIDGKKLPFHTEINGTTATIRLDEPLRMTAGSLLQIRSSG